jgi:hypothetical protein
MVHRTPIRAKIKQLLVKAQQLDQAIANLPLLHGKTDTELKIIQKQIEKDKSRILAEATTSKPVARLEDISAFEVKKQVRKNKFLLYCFSA